MRVRTIYPKYIYAILGNLGIMWGKVSSFHQLKKIQAHCEIMMPLLRLTMIVNFKGGKVQREMG